MASTRELWVILRGRDEASRMVHSFARNIRDAGNAVRIAQLHSQAAAVRQQAQLLKTNGAIAQQIRTLNQHATSLDKQARQHTLAAAQAREYRDTVLRTNGATNAQIASINQVIQAHERRASVLRAESSVIRNNVASMTQGLDNQVRALNSHAAALDAEARRLRDADRAALDHARSLRHLSVALQQSSDMALGLSFALGAAAAGGAVFMGKAVQAAVAYEKQVRLTATQVDGFKGNLEELGEVGMRVANEIGVQFEQVQPALFDIFSSMEVGVKDAEKLLKAFAKGAVAGQVEIQDVSRATIGLMNAFNRPVSDVNKLLDIQFQLVQEGIGTYEEWNQRIGLVTPSAVRAGQSVEMMAAALAAATRMGLSAARSGTSVARAMDAMSHPKSVKNMEALGIKVRDAHGRFLPMNKVLRDFRAVLLKMPEKDRVKAILDVFKGAGGTIEARRFLQNMLLGKKNIELFDEVLGEMQNTSGSMEKAYGTMADSVSVKTELLRNKWEMLKIGIGQALVPSVLQLVDALSRALDWFNRLPDSTKDIIAQFLLWGTAAAAVGAAFFVLIGVIALVVAAFTAAGTTILVVVGVLAGLTGALAGLSLAFFNLWKDSDQFRTLLSEIEIQFGRIKTIIADFAKGLYDNFTAYVLPPLHETWRIIEEEVLPVVEATVKQFSDKLIPQIQGAAQEVQEKLTPAFKAIGDTIRNDINPALQDLTKWWNENRTSILKVVDALFLVAKVAGIAGLIIGGSGLAGALGIAKLALAGFMGMLHLVTAAVNFQIGAVKGLWSVVKTLIDWIRRAGQAFNELKILVPGAMKVIADTVKRTFSDAGSWLVNAGRDVVEGFIRGVQSGIDRLRGVLSGITSMIPSWKGPKPRDLKLLYKPGQWVMQGFMRGIDSQVGALRVKMQGIVPNPLLPSWAMSGYTPMDAGLPSDMGSNSSNNNNKVIHNEFHISTQEIDPRKHAADLGWELAGRM